MDHQIKVLLYSKEKVKSGLTNHIYYSSFVDNNQHKNFQLGPFFIQKKKMKEKRELCHCFGVRVGDKTLTSLLDDLGF